MANFRNEWQSILNESNLLLAKYGMEIQINYDDDNNYSCVIKHKDGTLEDYAGNYYEHELEGLVMSAWNYANSLIGKY